MTAIAIADDHPIYTNGLANLLKEHFAISKVYIATNGIELLAIIKQNMVDLVLVDLQMPLMNGLEASEKIRLQYPDIPVIMISFFFEEHLTLRLKEIGVKGFLTKNTPITAMISCISKVLNGETLFLQSEESIVKVPGGVLPSPSMTKYRLSKRELEIISYIRRGYTSIKIASELFLSVNTVKQHRKHILRKLKLSNIQELVKFAIENGV